MSSISTCLGNICPLSFSITMLLIPDSLICNLLFYVYGILTDSTVRNIGETGDIDIIWIHLFSGWNMTKVFRPLQHQKNTPSPQKIPRMPTIEF